MKIKKAILTGGGRATRLYPVTTTINKHLLPLANKPMIVHAIEKVVAAGVEEIFINTNPGDKDLPQALGDGSQWGVKITFFEQTGGPQGIAHVVNEAQKYIGDEPFMFYLSDNILLGGVTEMVETFAHGEYDCMLAFSKVPDPQRFGVPVFDAEGNLTEVLEKPTAPPNDFAVTGIYLYGPKIFFDAFKHIQKSQRGEYEISDIHTHLLKQGKKVGYKEITGWWKDTGKLEDLLIANRLLLDHMADSEFVVDTTATVKGKVTGHVQIGAGAVIDEDSVVTGPVIIGDGVKLTHAHVGPNAVIGNNAVISQATISESILLERCVVEGDVRISKSLLGRGVSVKSAQSIQQAELLLGDKTMVHLS